MQNPEYTRASIDTPLALVYENDRSRIVYTNYWQSAFAKKGLCYLSANAGDWRLLVPKAQEAKVVPEFQSVKRATMEPSILLDDHIDVIAEDGSPAPFCISIDRDLLDRRFERRKCRLRIYTEDGEVANLPLKVHY